MHRVLFIKEYFAVFFLLRSIFYKHKSKKKRWISQNLLIICLKDISEKRFLFNGSVKVVNTSLRFLIKMPTQKQNFYKIFWENQTSQFKVMTLKFFSTIFFSFCIYIKLLFMLSISSKSHLITHSGVGCVGTRPFKVLGEYPGSRALGGHLGTWALRHLGHSGTWALKAIRNLGS